MEHPTVLCSCEDGNVVVRRSSKPWSLGCRYYACPKSKPGTTDRGCGYFDWLDEPSHQSTPQSHSPGPSSRPIRSSGPFSGPSHSTGLFSRPSHSPETSSRNSQNRRMAECSNCNFLAERIMRLEARISVLEGQLEMAMHPENHTLHSAGLLHDISNGMRNINFE